MTTRSTRCGAALLAILTAGSMACDSTRSTTITPALAPTGTASHDLIAQVYTSGSQVMSWDAIPETVQPANWAPAYCTTTPKVGRGANWTNPHHAFVVGHPWQNDYFVAPWINAWSTRESANSGNPVAPYYNWTRYSTEVEGNGSFVIRLLADNCSWVYLDGTLVGVQGTDLSRNSYGLTLNGKHTLEFIVFDGGGASGGKFKLETTTNPPPALNPDLDDDGHLNEADAFPLDPTEWQDSDHDGVGDNHDAFPNDPSEQKDSDGDGVGDNHDAYPNDPTRWLSDASAPVISHTITGGSPSASGWYGSDVAVTFAANDPDGPVTTSGCEQRHVTATTGADGVTFICTATSGGGTATDAVTIKLDKTIPTVTGAVTSGTLGAHDWYTDDVGITWSISAAGPSGQTQAPACASTTLTSDSPATTFTCSVTTGAGISSSPASVSVKRDAKTPTIAYVLTGAQGDDDWFTGAVGVVWTVTAGPSGADGCTSAPVSTDGTSITFTCSTTAGNGLSASRSTAPAKRDATKPTVTYAGNTGAYTVDQAVSISCTPSDALSGVRSSTCAPIAGDGYTFALGAHSYSATARDNAGNVGGASTTFTMSATRGSVCSLVRRWVSNAGVANSMCVKLEHGDYEPLKNELSAQTGKNISAANAAILLRLVSTL